MNTAELIAPEDVATLLRGRMGLIIGPDATVHPDASDELNQSLANQFQIDCQESMFSTCDLALQNGASDEDIRSAITHFIGAQTPAPSLSVLARARWCSVLSFALDDFLEAKLRQESEKSLTRRSIHVVDDFLKPEPGRVIPIFKLLGSSNRRHFSYCSADHFAKKATWRHAVRGFAERVKGNPVLCLGCESNEQLFMDLIGEFIADPRLHPSMFVFFCDSPLLENAQVRRLISSRMKLRGLSGSLNSLVKALSSAHSAGYAPTLPFESDGHSESQLQFGSDILSIVNEDIASPVSLDERTLLLDLLFSPDAPRWDPYCHDLDFRRSLSSTLTSKIRGRFSKKSRHQGAFVIRGAAASGKTTLLRRLSVDLASPAVLVLWLKPSFFPGSAKTLDQMFAQLAEVQGKQQICLMIDDPFAPGKISAQDIHATAVKHGVRLTLIVAVRETDWLTADSHLVLGGYDLEAEFAIPHEFDESEWSRLPDYLVRIGASPSQAAAVAEVDAVGDRSAQDVLSTLYYLLPQTKSQIVSSVRDEFVRLGDFSTVQKLVIGESLHDTSLLKDAYEMVAVSSRYGVPLPIEVLVSALNVDYSSWLDAARADGPAWGVLYSIPSDGEETICYTPRNALVTRFIVEAINGGRLSRAGEVRALLALINACTSRSSPVYREFCARILVNNTVTSSLDYADGLALYDAAVNALPFDDKTLLHHRARWVKNKGNDPIAAIALLKECLTKSDYPYSDKRESPEHIYTTLAASVVDAVDSGAVSIADGKEEAFEYLSKARSGTYFNTNAVHVQAEVSKRLLDRMTDDDDVDRYHIAARSLSDIDNAITLIGSEHTHAGELAEDIGYLESARDRLFMALGADAKVQHTAMELWETHGSQEGFVIHARSLLRTAADANKGSLFSTAYDHCNECCSLAEKAGVPIAQSLLDAKLQIYYRWQVQRSVFSGGEMFVDWNMLHDLALQLLSAGNEPSPFHHYIRALALAHMGRWSDASVIFAQMRRMNLPRHVMWARRDFLLEENGKARKVQGQLREGVNRNTFYCEELHTDFPADRSGNWNKVGEDDFAYVHFSFGGPTAIDRYSLTAKTSLNGSDK